MFGFAIISLCLSAQEKMVKIGTSLDYGSTFTFSVEPTEGDSIIVDFGDGKKVKKGTRRGGEQTRTSRASFSVTRYAYTGL